MTGLVGRINRYRRIHGTRSLLRETTARLIALLRSVVPHGAGPAAAQSRQWTGLRLFKAPAPAVPRISVVTGSFDTGSSSEGAGMAVIFACLLAQARGASLRIITRNERARPTAFAQLLSIHGIELAQDVAFAFAPCDGSWYELDFHDGELFVATSWWTTAAAMASVPHDSIVYLLRQDERASCPDGDEHLLCASVMANADMRFVVEGPQLFDRLVQSGLDNVARNGIAFEPAFSQHVISPQSLAPVIGRLAGTA